METKIFAIYENFKDNFNSKTNDDELNKNLFDLFDTCQEYLSKFQVEPLSSTIQNKSYISFRSQKKLSRPINKSLYNPNKKDIILFFEAISKRNIHSFSPDQITAICYTLAISFCASIDMIKEGDQKTPGTFFEYLMGHLFRSKFRVHPKNSIDVLNLDMKSKLPTDFIFDLGKNQPKYHVPVKTSTRERVIQVWAHQRVLDGVYGTGRFVGLLTCLNETKLNHRTKEVVEICLPDQWQLYQLFIAQLKRIYYLDVPQRYAELNMLFPKIHVRQFGDFFHETDLLLE